MALQFKKFSENKFFSKQRQKGSIKNVVKLHTKNVANNLISYLVLKAYKLGKFQSYTIFSPLNAPN